MTDPPAKAALYARASTDHQKYSVLNQTDALHAYAKEHNLVVVKIYEDDGVSGLSLRGRKGLTQLLQDVLVRPEAYQVLLIYDVSRWGRFQDIDESAYYEHLCRRAGINVIYTAEPFQNDIGPVASLIKALKRTMAAEYSRELSVKAFVGHVRVASLGFSQGGVANYGLARMLLDGDGNPIQRLRPGERKGLQSDRVKLCLGPPDEVAIVRLIFDLFANKGLTTTQIARHLQGLRVPSPNGRQWYGVTISTFLKNEKYLGHAVYNRTSLKLKQPRVINSKEAWIKKENAFEGIISRKLFQKAQTRFAAMPKRPSREVLLDRLRSLYVEHGRLSPNLIDNSGGMLASHNYSRRFGSLTNAYALVGFSSNDTRNNSAWWAAQREQRRQDYAEKLRDLLNKKGSLTKAIIDNEPGFPPASSFFRLFGSLGKAYDYIGFNERRKPGPAPKERIQKYSAFTIRSEERENDQERRSGAVGAAGPKDVLDGHPLRQSD